MKLGRLGVWYSTDKHADPAGIAAFTQTVERLGYDTLWYPESRGYESFTVAGYMLSSNVGLRVTLALSLVALIMVAIAENARIPVDNPATHLELTMVHEAMVLEYSGRHLALIELTASLKLILYMSLIACLFAPWELAVPGAPAIALALGAAAYLGKLAIGGFLLALFETATAKMRVFRVPQFLGAALMLGLLGTLLLFVSRSF